MTPLCTIGYEGSSPAAWLDTLRAHSVQVVVDVRDLPLSRRRGFSKSALQESLGESGLEYVHVRALGNPKELRQALKTGLPFDDFARTFTALLDDRDDALDLVAALSLDKRVCLLCFEEDPAHCHRSLVADRLAAMSNGALEVEHLRHAG